MDFRFGSLKFAIENDKIFLTEVGDFAKLDRAGFCEVQVAGRDKITHAGIKMISSSEGPLLKYVSHSVSGDTLEIVQRTDIVEATTYFEKYDDTNAIRVYTEVKNISCEDITLEEVSAFVFTGIGERGIDSSDSLSYTRFFTCNYGECQPREQSFRELGLYRANAGSPKRIAFANVGSWSTKEELPQGIITDRERGMSLMFQIESNNSWYYEIADTRQSYYLYLGGANQTFGAWCKNLASGESYRTVSVAICVGNCLNETIAQMTKYRRHIAGRCSADETLPSIFNSYMHLFWDSPEAEKIRKYAPAVAALGVEYYVIDCGWHNEEPGNIIYPYVGQWKESNARFPLGVREITDYIRSLGMKAGLWIEPEIIGKACADMIDFYDEDCFLQRHGKRLCIHRRHFLDYRNKKVIAYMTETIRRMVEDYGADYIKMDYNQDCATGTDYMADSAGEGLESHSKAYLDWVDEMRRRFPQVLFETCSSGGMRMDYSTLSHFSIVSTSDQVRYRKYPYIAANIFSAVLPEQAAVWSYPVDSWVEGFAPTEEWVNANVSDEQIIMNMINSFLGRMHLASHIELFNAEKTALIKEGVDYYNSLRAIKRSTLPYLPLGFTRYDVDTTLASGIMTENKLYLAVWNLGGEKNVSIPLEGITPKAAKVAYPARGGVEYRLSDGKLEIEFTEDYQARMLEIDI